MLNSLVFKFDLGAPWHKARVFFGIRILCQVAHFNRNLNQTKHAYS